MELHIFGFLLASCIFHVGYSITDCTNVYITNHEGIITSPNYPDKYPDFTSCSWYIDIPKNSTLSISILDLSIEADLRKDCEDEPEASCCQRNWLSVPMVTKSTHSTHVLCGIHPVKTFDLPDTVKIASIKFHSSKNIKGGRGFKIKYFILPKEFVKCNDNYQFTCASHQQCIDASRRCDGIKDCDDHSDEKNCAIMCTLRDLASCAEAPHICYNSTAQPCAKQVVCPDTMGGDWILCKDGSTCFRREQMCDTTIDCDDQSDEANCKPSTASSRDSDVFFLCDNWKWVRVNQVCDGTDNCGDHSDEDGCVTPSFETAIILGCLSCSLLLILLVSYTCHAHQHTRGIPTPNTSPPLRPLLNINSQPYMMPFREPPPPYPMDPPPSRRRYRRHRRHTRMSNSPAPVSPQLSPPLDECSQSPPQEQAVECTWKAPEEQQEEAVSTD